MRSMALEGRGSKTKTILITTLLAALASAPARAAQPAAEALFEEGKRLLTEGKTAEACEKLTASERIDHSLGTLGLLSLCHEQQGKTATAYREYQETARTAHATGDAREALAAKRAAELAPTIPRLTIKAKEPNDFYEVTLNGAPIASDKLGAEMLLDPGSYVIMARAPGAKPYRTTVDLKASSNVVVDMPKLDVPPPPAPPAPAAVPVAPKEVERGLGPRVTGGLVLGGVGLVGLGVGIGFGLAAAGKNADSKQIAATCDSAASCEEGHAIRDDARRAATISTIGFGVGAAALAAGVVLVISGRSQGVEPEKRAKTTRGVAFAPVVGPTVSGGVLRGRF